MPIYEYRCEKCTCDFEKLVFGKEEVTCPKCGGQVEKLMSACSFKSAAGDFKTTPGTSGGKSCGGCSATSCATCH
jgi:putative FmdB family regulatory protein